MTVLRRIAPALFLLVLSPLIAEFLLGDFSVRQLALLPVFIPQYGGGALLVREVTRRTERGWPTMLLLALAYALVEEGFTTETFFNPTYAGHRLLDYGYIPALGTSLNWVAFVLALHIVWSIGSSIAIAEGLAGSRWKTPWTGKLGLSLTVALFLVGCGFTIVVTARMFPYVATGHQFGAVALATLAAVATAFWFFPVHRRRLSGSPPSVWVVGAAALLLASGFHALNERGAALGLPAAATLAGMLLLQLLAVALLGRWSRRKGWQPNHALAAAVGAVLTYGWISIVRMVLGGTALGLPTTKADVAGQILLLIGVLAAAYAGSRRLTSASGTTD